MRTLLLARHLSWAGWNLLVFCRCLLEVRSCKTFSVYLKQGIVLSKRLYRMLLLPRCLVLTQCHLHGQGGPLIVRLLKTAAGCCFFSLRSSFGYARITISARFNPAVHYLLWYKIKPSRISNRHSFSRPRGLGPQPLTRDPSHLCRLLFPFR